LAAAAAAAELRLSTTLKELTAQWEKKLTEAQLDAAAAQRDAVRRVHLRSSHLSPTLAR
jgi:hypothetical protein